ncbi:MAG: extracellular solute-binding protein [Capsulimonas sp.]|uniref:ABC transporter substrate-binding protein n=1 Tax=Capsulimonas sp. TaxID=2494211 RepID=UPI003264C8A8
MRYFPFGRAAFSILMLAVASGAWLSLQPAPKHHATLTYWTYANTHYNSYKKVIPEFERQNPGVTVDLELVSLNALSSRMQAAMLADLDVPDIFEMEIGQSGTLFRGPTKDIGLVDLGPRIHAPGPDGAPPLWDRMVHARFSPYTNRGHIYGLPHDVHAVQLAYRRDIFEKAGVDVSQIKTWDDFVKVGRKMTIPNKRYMMEMSDSDATVLEPLLFQRGGGYFDENGRVIMDNEIAVQTMCWYVPLVAGPHKIASNVGYFGQVQTKAVEDGYMLCYICPDWRSKTFENDVSHMKGKMGLMPVPLAAPNGPQTTTWGGTMVGLTKHNNHQDLAWKLAMFLLLDKTQVAERYRATNILPPVKDLWADPAFHERSAYWSNEKTGESYIRLAPEVPPHYSSPVIQTATDKFSQALIDCVHYYNVHGYVDHGDAQFESYVRSRLKLRADQVRAMAGRNPY